MAALQFNPVGLFAKAISRGKTPKDTKMLLMPLVFGGTGTTYAASIDTTPGSHNKWGIADIQSVFCDNSTNSVAISVTFDNGYSFTCPAYAQAVFPVFFSGSNLNFVASTSNVNASVTLYFLNTREQAQIWATQLPIAGTVNVSGSTIFATPTPVGGTSRTGTIAVGGTAVQIMAANANRKRFILQNPSTAARQGIGATELIVFGFAASPSMSQGFELYPGASYDTGGGPCSTDAIYVNAATAGHIIIGEEFQ